MIPVHLRLHNFLSYGTSAPVLDFELFRVACLSGRNGQGKSALLDAITWALWGEARKSAGGHKPDEELIRIGTRRMEVELLFDLEGERYRITRSFQRSASGKTSKPGLELNVLDPELDDFRPLTGASVRETQQRLDDLMGIDYNTFINSAFLLQGRSDEFTKKRPTERKEILARILNLSRYDRLADLAREKVRHYDQEMKQATYEVDRLQAVLVEAPEWATAAKAVQQAIAEGQAALSQLRGEEKEITTALARFESLKRELASLKTQQAQLAARRQQDAQVHADLRRRIEAAAGLLAQQAQIRADYERAESLRADQERLVEQQVLHLGIEKQLTQREGELRDRRNAVEKRLHQLEVETRNAEQNLADCRARLSERAAVDSGLARAREAEKERIKQQAIQSEQAALKETVTACETALKGLQEGLRGEARTLQRQMEQDRAAAPQRASLQDALKAAEKREAERLRLTEELDRVRTQGQALREALGAEEARVAALQQDQAVQAEEAAAIATLDVDMCPTCGTELTPTHRRTVADQLQAKLRTLQGRLEAANAKKAQLEDQVGSLRNQYKAVNEAVVSHADAPEQLAQARAAMQQADLDQAALQAKATRREALQKQLADKAYGAAERAQRSAALERLRALHFDAEAYDRLVSAAAQLDRYEEQQRRLEAEAGKAEQLEHTIETKKAERTDLLRQLDDGRALGAIQSQIDRLKDQLARTGFNPARLAEVRLDLKTLGDVGARLKDLMNAQANRDDWANQASALETRLAEATTQLEKGEASLTALQDQLEGHSALQARKQENAAALRTQEAIVQQAQMELGQLQAKLAQAEQNRKALAAQKKAFKTASQQLALYKHLRTAFGKNGIPSLIIEQTLPEIEERTNELLDRLTDGRMHIHLETLKDKKAGGTKETLDIKITDEQGVSRPYETFSGGEGFRVNFALRIALSQLLAERSGVRIRTLVIDEGFGTQDALGVQNLVDAIQTIQSDFDKIIVITHLEQLKEAFPVRIEVVKDPVEGSSFEILGV